MLYKNAKENRKTRFSPEKSGKNLAKIRFAVWTSTAKPFFEFCLKKPANPHKYYKRLTSICQPFMSDCYEIDIRRKWGHKTSK